MYVFKYDMHGKEEILQIEIGERAFRFLPGSYIVCRGGKRSEFLEYNP